MVKSFLVRHIRGLAKAKAKDKANARRNNGKDLFDNVHKTDLNYVTEALSKNGPLCSTLASMLRNGSLENELKKKIAGGQHLELGKLLGIKMKRIRNLPPRFWELLWMNLWAEHPPTSKETKLSIEDHRELACWALAITSDCLVPTRHKGSGYEGPLLAVLKQRHVDMGSRLSNMTRQMYADGAWGYFALPQPFLGAVLVRGHDLTFTVVHEEVAQMTTDWSIANNGTMEATVESESLGCVQCLFTVLTREKGSSWVKANMPEHVFHFEYPNAADRFPEPKPEYKKKCPLLRRQKLHHRVRLHRPLRQQQLLQRTVRTVW